MSIKHTSGRTEKLEQTLAEHRGQVTLWCLCCINCKLHTRKL